MIELASALEMKPAVRQIMLFEEIDHTTKEDKGTNLCNL